MKPVPVPLHRMNILPFGDGEVDGRVGLTSHTDSPVIAYFPTQQYHSYPWRFSAPFDVTTGRENLVRSDFKAFPPTYTPMEQDEGPPLMVINPVVLQPVRAGQAFTREGLHSSGLIGHGTRPGGVGYSLTFTTAGTFRYMCPIHPGMVGTIVVEDQGP